MSSGWVIVGTIGQLVLGGFLFMFSIFAGAGIANGNELSKTQIRMLDISIFMLPAVCVFSAGVVLVLYKAGASASAYWWHVLPLLTAAVYTLLLVKLAHWY
jgi:hypothetical protein